MKSSAVLTVGFFTLLLGVVTAGPAAAAATTQPATAAAYDKSFFPIMIWDGVPGDAATIARIKDCGVTVAGFVAPKDLPAIESAGLKCIVSDARTSGYDWSHVDEATAKKNVHALVAEVGKSPAVFGYYLRDEPPAGLFPGLATVADLVREAAPGKWPYINLFPNYAEPWQLQTPDYPTYLEKFVQTCHPPILSYDHYALMEDGSLKDGYWQNLESMRALGLKHNIPFWNIVLANAHFDHPEPTAAGMRFQVYSTLAYGGRGIAYFTYFAPKVGNYRAAAIDQFGNPTPTWDYLRNVNHQVLKLAPTLLKLKSTRVYHFAKTNGCQLPPADSLLSSAGGDHFMAGEFTCEGDAAPYVMVVNKDLKLSHPVDLHARKPAKSVKLVSPYTGELMPFEGEQIWLAPGQGSLLRVEQ